MFDVAPYSTDDESTVREIWMQAFDTPADYWTVFTGRIGAENIRTLKSDGTPLGLLGVYRMGQWFGGKCVGCGGFAAVAVAPEHRQRGAARHMLTSALQELRAGGVPLAALYPSSQAVYRAIGFEQAGSRCLYELPLTQIGLKERGVSIHRAPTSDPTPFEAIYREVAAQENGRLERTPGLWERLLVNPFGHPQYAYVVKEEENPIGYVIYYLDDAGPGAPTQLFIRDWCALTAAAARRLWTLIADHRSTVASVNWFGSSDDAMLAHVAECKPTRMSLERWMLRVLDVTAALESRGYPAVDAELHLDVSDPLIVENTGRFVLRVREGAPTVERGGRGDVRCDIRGLAPLYTGMFGAPELVRLGWISGTAEALGAATRLFSGSPPWMPEYF